MKGICRAGAAAIFPKQKSSQGVDRFAARKQIVARLEEKGMVEKIEPHCHVVPHGDRSNVVIEPFLTDQWYVNAHELAKPAIAAVRSGQDHLRAEELGNDLFQLDGEHPALVHLAPALVGPPDTGVVWTATSVWKARLIQQFRRYSLQHPKQKRSSQPDPRMKAFRWMSRVTQTNGRHGVVSTCMRSKQPILLKRDEDVLDTWFSSALWPFSTLGLARQDT